MRSMMAVVGLIAASFLAGCVAGQPTYYEASGNDRPDSQTLELRNSLFPSDSAVMSNDNIQQVLDSRLLLPGHARITVLRVGVQERLWWTESVAQQDEIVLERLLETLRGSPRVERATVMPSILVPPRITIPLLREMAARTQSDLVLLYQSRSHIYTRSRAFSPDETKACCVVEAFLLDTRSGVIPFATAKTETYSAKKTNEDLEFAETVRKAEIAATGKALDRVAADVLEFLKTSPARPDQDPNSTTKRR